MYVRLIRKPALALNGLDVSRVSVGDVLSLPEDTGLMLVAEGWADRIDKDHPPPMEGQAHFWRSI
jgi:hypothetical protein